MREASVDAPVVQQLAGHSSDTMMDHYTGWLARACRDAVEAHVGRLDGHSR
ncbi:MAG: hypothetical protein ACRDYA_10430 [Egibacteraceae bacterium]